MAFDFLGEALITLLEGFDVGLEAVVVIIRFDVLENHPDEDNKAGGDKESEGEAAV